MSIGRWMDKEAVVCIHNGVLLSHKKVCIWVHSNEVDELRACYTEWSKSEKEKQISYINAYMWNLERWYWWTYLQGGNGDTDIENRLTDTSRGRKEKVGWTERVAWKHIHCCSKTDSQWEFTVWPRELQLRLCNNLEGWEGMEGRFQREGTYVYLWLIHGAIW